MQRFLPATLAVVLKEEGPDTMLNLFDGESDTPELIWNGSMRVELRQVIAEQLDACIEKRQESGAGDERFSLTAEIQVKYKNLERELFVGGVYVSRFLKEPTYNVRDPTAFLEMLLQRWTHELKLFTSQELGSKNASSTELVLGAKDSLQSVTDASVYLCKVRTNLCDKLSQWGYMARCLSFLDDILTQQFVGTPLLSVMRVLHVAVTRRQNVESLIISGRNDRLHGIVPFTKQAAGYDGLHPDVAFMIDMLKRLFIEALGDLKNAPKSQISSADSQSSYNASQIYMAPSPAPGEGPVSRNRVTMGNPLDDPLAFAAAPAGNNATSQPQGMPGYQAPLQNAGTSYGAPTLTSHLTYQQRDASMTGAQTPLGYGSNQTHTGYSMGNQQTMPTSTAPTSQYFSGAPPLPSQVQHQSQSSYPGVTAAGQEYQPRAASPGTARFQQSYVSPLQNAHYATATSTFQQPMAAPLPRQSMPPHQQLTHQTSSYLSRQSSHQQPTAFPHVQQQPPSMPQYSQQQNRGMPQGQHMGSYQAHQQSSATTRVQTTSQVPPGPRMQQQVFQQGNSRGNVDPRFQQPSAAQSSVQVQNSPTQLSQGIYPTQMQPPPPREPLPTPQYQEQAMAPAIMHAGSSNTTRDQDMVRATPNPIVQENFASQGTGLQQSQLNEGSGIDARTKLDPKEEAEIKTTTCPGAPGAADGRVALLQSALTCDLPKFLVEDVLENPKLSSVKDPAATKVHSVELLKLLTNDPGYGMKFQMILDAIPSWNKYKKQDHSLFITGAEKTMVDYFLTDGSGSRDPKKLLTQG